MLQKAGGQVLQMIEGIYKMGFLQKSVFEKPFLKILHAFEKVKKIRFFIDSIHPFRV